MTTDEKRELMLIYASGQADPAEREHARGLLRSGDAEAAGLLTEALTVLADLSGSLDPVTPSPAVRARLGRLLDAAVPASVTPSPVSGAPRGAVVEASPAEMPPDATRPSPPLLPPALAPRWPWALAGGLAAAAAVALAATVMYPRQQLAELADRRVETERLTQEVVAARGELDEAQSEGARLLQAADTARVQAERQAADATRLADEAARAQALARDAAADAQRLMQEATQARASSERLTNRAAELEALRTALARPDLRVVPLAGTESQPGSGARLLWDAQGGQMYFFAHGLEPAGAAKDYQLWVVTKGGDKVSVGVFDAGAGGGAVLTEPTDLPTGDIAAAAVTDEPAGGSPQPTGSFQLLGEF